jgi:hypothetical protein
MNRMRWLLAIALGLTLVTAGVGVGLATTSDAPSREGAGVQANETDDNETGENETGDSAEDGAEGPDVAIGDPTALEKASAAALDYLAEQGLHGQVSATEEGDEESYYEIEVTLDDGSQVDVQLTETFEVVGLD